jgi:hypothetical protein
MTDQEIERLVAEKIMGWTRHGDELHGPVFGDLKGLYSYPVANLKIGVGCCSIPKYCTSIADAFEVRDKVVTWKFSDRRKFKFWLMKIITEKLHVENELLIAPDEVILYVQPRDICEAALKVKGVEI